MENYTKEQLSNLTDEQLFDLRAELLKGLDDDLANGSAEVNTLEAADSLAEDLHGRLFEEDNSFFDFTSPLDANSLKAVMADLRINFSREKLAFACKIIAALNAKSPAETAIVAKPAKEGAPLPEISSTEKKELIPQDVPQKSAQEKTEAESPRQVSPAGTPPRPQKPNAAPPSGWTSSGNTTSTKQTQSPSSSSKTFKVPPRRVGFWERNFASVGRRIDRFLEKIFH